MSKPKFKRMAKGINQIILKPAKWNQGVWHDAAGNENCGTVCCFAGWADVLDPTVEIPSVNSEAFEKFADDTKERAQKYYGLDDIATHYLFDEDRTFAQLYVYVLTQGQVRLDDVEGQTNAEIKTFPLLDTKKF